MMAGTQLYAYGDGTVRECETWEAPNLETQNRILDEAFSCKGAFGHEWIERKGPIRSVKLRYGGRDQMIYFANRAVSGGGRAQTRPQELRVQVQPAIYNDLVACNESGEVGLLIGVYVNGESAAIAVWRPTIFSEGTGSASKQIDAETVAQAMQLGYEMQVYPSGDTTVWVGRPELFLSHLDYLRLNPPTQGAQYGTEDAMASAGSTEQYNFIYFGAPGTGKSYKLREDAEKKFDEDKICRVTFHPEYTYSQFVGSLRPRTAQSEDGKRHIYYAFTPGPFIETYVKALRDPDNPYVLIIEEINRANPAAVFGDIFQLLDRDHKGRSDYPVKASDELRQYLEEEFIDLPSQDRDALISELAIPSNMYLWATMNSADQGVFPMDTAFKRRWDFCYVDIDEGEKEIDDIVVPLGKTERAARWNDLRKEINRILLEARVNEDKLLGPFFIDPKLLIDDEGFTETFKSKVLLYLAEDAAKTKKEKVFEDGLSTYSQIAKAFDERGEKIFKGMRDIATGDSPADEETIPSEEEMTE